MSLFLVNAKARSPEWDLLRFEYNKAHLIGEKMIYKSKQLTFSLALLLLLGFFGSVYAEIVKGRVVDFSRKASTIQLDLKGKSEIIRFNEDTKWDGLAGIKELKKKELLKIDYKKGGFATNIKKVTFALPAGTEIKIDELKKIMASGKPYTLVDARPAIRFPAGHIPTAISIFGNDLEQHVDKLPSDMNQLVIFYCGGPTCPFTGISIKKAMELGYTNVKGYQDGLPDWKSKKQIVHSSPTWVAKNLDEHHVIIDTRSHKVSDKLHIKSAVSMSKRDFEKLEKKQEGSKTKRLPGAYYTGAPIILYGDTDKDEDLLDVFNKLVSWKYKKVTVLAGGFKNWKTANLPTQKAPVKRDITFVKKLMPGAVEPVKFMKYVDKKDKDVVVLDVRTELERKGGFLKDALWIPLDQVEDRLKEIPRDKKVIAFCKNGARAAIAYQQLVNLGYNNVAYLNESMEFLPDGSYKICCVEY